MFAAMNGRLFKARISDREETVRGADGRPRKLRRYEITGDKRQTVWFDESGVPLALRSEENGMNIDFVLTSPDPARLPARSEAVPRGGPRWGPGTLGGPPCLSQRGRLSRGPGWLLRPLGPDCKGLANFNQFVLESRL